MGLCDIGREFLPPLGRTELPELGRLVGIRTEGGKGQEVLLVWGGKDISKGSKGQGQGDRSA